MRAFLAYVVAVLVLVNLFGSREARAADAVSSHSAAVTAAPAAKMKAVVRAWNDRLDAGDNAGIARLFAVPALVIQGAYSYLLRTRAEVAEWFSLLPCAARIVSIAVRGRYATAVFRLANRGSTPCDAPGALAAARFEIVGGKIASWEQVPVPVPQPKAPSEPVA